MKGFIFTNSRACKSKEVTRYFITTQSALSGLYAVEKRLAKAARPFDQTLATEQELERIVEYFEDLYEVEKEKNHRTPDICIGLVRYSDKPYFLNIGNYTLSLKEVKPLPEFVNFYTNV